MLKVNVVAIKPAIVKSSASSSPTVFDQHNEWKLCDQMDRLVLTEMLITTIIPSRDFKMSENIKNTHSIDGDKSAQSMYKMNRFRSENLLVLFTDLRRKRKMKQFDEYFSMLSLITAYRSANIYRKLPKLHHASNAVTFNHWNAHKNK